MNTDEASAEILSIIQLSKDLAAASPEAQDLCQRLARVALSNKRALEQQFEVVCDHLSAAILVLDDYTHDETKTIQLVEARVLLEQLKGAVLN